MDNGIQTVNSQLGFGFVLLLEIFYSTSLSLIQNGHIEPYLSEIVHVGAGVKGRI